MTEVSFHFNADDKLAYTCRLLRKAVAQGKRVMVTADPQTVLALDKALWEFSAQDFIDHVRIDEVSADGAALETSSQVRRARVLLGSRADAQQHREVLVNLDVGVQAGFERFERVIEVVGSDDADRQAARQRWKHYKELGFEILPHDLQSQGG